ncbi:O-methyltransferase family protein [Proteiniborus sp. DW1]|uniref:O-methyltransferase n=1 Tax=Proteiniborus sp. DW1 TaxID=1889883 RepID=UPI00092E01F8|nr:O-methyltransferase [Proteiniborus sp. DW1]SCG83271.1 O-methyltransferase family protein [Proteiniborus sp. DW1]
MSNINESSVEEYIRSLVPRRESFLMELEMYAKLNHVPIIHPEVAQLIRVLLNIAKPKRILEIGTAIGYSALIMASVIERDGRIISIEKREDMINMAEKNIHDSGYSDMIKIIKGEAEEVLPNINDEFDFIFIDAAKGQYMEFFPHCIRNLAEGGIILSDNVLYKGMVASDDLVLRRKKTIVKRMRSYLDYITSNKDLESSVIPIGDGVAITYKKEVEKNE